MIRIRDRTDRVREHSAPEVNRRVDQETKTNLQLHAAGDHRAIERRLRTLDEEWDAERVLMTNASALAFTGLVLGTVVNRKWLLLPGAVLPFLFQQAVQGWCPPLPVLRRVFGVRTRKEVDREKYALKALRGDFSGKRLNSADPSARAEEAMEAASR